MMRHSPSSQDWAKKLNSGPPERQPLSAPQCTQLQKLAASRALAVGTRCYLE